MLAALSSAVKGWLAERTTACSQSTPRLSSTALNLPRRHRSLVLAVVVAVGGCTCGPKVKSVPPQVAITPEEDELEQMGLIAVSIDPEGLARFEVVTPEEAA